MTRKFKFPLEHRKIGSRAEEQYCATISGSYCAIPVPQSPISSNSNILESLPQVLAFHSLWYIDQINM